jgi:hypothetical protein
MMFTIFLSEKKAKSLFSLLWYARGGAEGRHMIFTIFSFQNKSQIIAWFCFHQARHTRVDSDFVAARLLTLIDPSHVFHSSRFALRSGVSENVMVGNLAPCGTGAFDLVRGLPRFFSLDQIFLLKIFFRPDFFVQHVLAFHIDHPSFHVRVCCIQACFLRHI